MELYDALLAETCADVNMIRHFDTNEDIRYDDRFNAITFIDPKTLESAFEHEYSRDPANRNLIVRGHNGRIYGSGCYDDTRKEAKYQAFIHDAPRVAVAIEAMKRFNAERAVSPNQHRLCCFDALQSDYNPAFQDDIVQYWTESYPYDLQEAIQDPRMSPSYTAVSDNLFEEPFIRAPVISQAAEDFMEAEFYEPYWEQQAQENEDGNSYIDWDVEEPDDYDW
jgi:hypothetical protein